MKDVFAGALGNLVPTYYQGPFISLVATPAELTIGVGIFLWVWKAWRIPSSAVQEIVHYTNGWLIRHTGTDAPEKIVLWERGPSLLGPKLQALGYSVRTDDGKISVMTLEPTGLTGGSS